MFVRNYSEKFWDAFTFKKNTEMALALTRRNCFIGLYINFLQNHAISQSMVRFSQNWCNMQQYLLFGSKVNKIGEGGGGDVDIYKHNKTVKP
jgi:hypothetical protein